MKETITAIEEVSDVSPSNDEWLQYDGYKVTTNKRNIYVLVSNGQC